MSEPYRPAATDIAIVGMSARVPGARNIAEFWGNVRHGVESVRRLSTEELLAAGVNPADLAKPNYVRAAAILDGLAAFDAGFFGFSPKDASIMDPQHRHFLECCWEAMEHAAHVPESFPGAIGVFGGCGMNAYFMFHLLTNRELMESTGMFLVRHTGNDKDFLCTRVSYQFNLKGPSISVQTACSTSLVAVHMACQSLINGECDMALAGGVTIEIPHGRGYLYEEGEILSRDGHCRAFDAHSTGTVFGSGVGVVVLRRMQDALDNEDSILAVIRGSAINNDGSGKVGYLAPGLDGQAAVYAEALSVSGVAAESIGYIETHGTGTNVGDPIEVEALAEAFRPATSRTRFCAIGSVKTNIGHLDTAAGVVGLIKAVQALRHREIPPSLHFEKPNPLIAFEQTPFYVNTALRGWPSGPEPRRAGVSSLGVGGTNAHIILEEAPPAGEREADGEPWILPLSAKTATALEAASSRLAENLRQTPERLADIAFTLQRGRSQFSYRLAVVSREPAAASSALALRDPLRVVHGLAEKDLPVAFLFAGGGAQYPGMGEGLYRSHALYREILDEGFARFHELTGQNLKLWLFPSAGAVEAARRYMERPLFGLPALFLTQYATARLWMSMGVKPAAITGHSVGAYAAACVAKVMTLTEGLSIVIERGRLFETLPAGAMLSVALPEGELHPLLGARLSLAAVNSPELSVVSGPVEEIAGLEERLRERGVPADRVHIDVAAHSRMLEPILGPFRAAAGRLQLQSPQIPFVSCFKGTWVNGDETRSAEFWTSELRHTVRFSDSARTLLAGGTRVFIEMGPGQTLSTFLRDQPTYTAAHSTIASLRNFKTQADDSEWFLASVGRAWACGLDVDWTAAHNGRTGRRVELPTYAWDHKDYWIEAGSHSLVAAAAASSPPAELRKQADPADWFYQPVWRRGAESPVVPLAGSGPWLVLGDHSELSASLLSLLRAQGEQAVLALPGELFSKEQTGDYRIRTGFKQDYEALLAALATGEGQPRRIVHLWSKRGDSFEGLLFLVQALAETGMPMGTQLVVVTERLHAVDGAPADNPLQALSLGAVRVAPQELPEMNCLAIDVDRWDAHAARAVLKEAMAAQTAVTACAIRGGARWEESFESAPVAEGGELRLRHGGVYLITGGQGGIGLAIARQFAASGKKPKLVLMGRGVMPADDPRRAAIQELEEAGAEVLVLAADVADPVQAAAAVADVVSRFGPIHGVLHAAGVIDDGPLSWKTAESVRAVLRPKVEGTRVLADLLSPETLDFFVLFSSTSALLGLAGQIDYAAANAFLDAFAGSRKGVRVIDWAMWRSTGMTSRFLSNSEIVMLDTRTDWMLADHRMRSGQAILPGSAYAGLARHAALGDAGEGSLRIGNLLFLAPLGVPDGQPVAARVVLRNGKFSVSTELNGISINHATADVSLLPKQSSLRHNLEPIEDRCRRRQVLEPDTSAYTRQGEYISFGERWNVIRRASFGDGEALLELELPQKYQGDTVTHPLHPALLDWATSGGLPVAPGYDLDPRLHVPMSVAEIVVHHRLPPRIISHVRLSSSGSSGYDTVVFDTTICDPDGWELATVNGFTLRRIEKSAEFLPAPDQNRGKLELSPLEAIANAAILLEEGTAAFARILASPGPARVVVSPLPLRTLLQQVQPQRRAMSAIADDQEQAPEDEVEKWLVETCRDLLGVPRVRPEDDFFALGGHSLVAVRLFLRIRKKYQLDLGISTLFEARPLAKLAALIRSRAERTGDAGETAERWSSVVPIQPGTPERPAVYLIHGVGGNVVGFEPLVRRLGAEFPIYAIQCVGIDGKLKPLTRVEDMAARYIDDIRAVQPRGPYHFIGYSFGGMIAFEMAQQLTAAGETVGFVGMMDTWQHAWLPWHHRRTLAARILRHGRRVLFGPDRMAYLTSHLGLLQRLTAAKIDVQRGTQTGLPQDLFHIVNARAAFDYVPKPYEGQVTLFRAKERHDGDPYPYHLGWEGLAKGGLEIHEVPGTHLNMGEEPNVRALAELLPLCLKRTPNK